MFRLVTHTGVRNSDLPHVIVGEQQSGGASLQEGQLLFQGVLPPENLLWPGTKLRCDTQTHTEPITRENRKVSFGHTFRYSASWRRSCSVRKEEEGDGGGDSFGEMEEEIRLVISHVL